MAHVFGYALFLYLCGMEKVKRIAPCILQVVLGLVFIFSAIMKVIGMDRFEIYIYSYHFFSLNFSFLVARAAIIAELVLGIGLVANRFQKLMWWGSVAMMGGYTLLLFYALVLGRTDSCHCFGDILQFNPWQSILKNIVLLGLFALIYKNESRRFKHDWLALIAVVLVSSVAVFVVSPPDNFTPNYNPEHNLNEELFLEALNESPLDTVQLSQGKQVVALFSTGCEYCQMSAQKLSLMQQHYGFPEENVTFVFIGSEEGIDKFYEKSESKRYRSVLYEDVVRFLIFSDGVFPTIVFMDNGEVVHEYGFRNMKEAEIKAFFGAKN